MKESKKYKRTNYLIDKPFQLGFITRFVIIIVITIIFTFAITLFYYWFVSSVGKLKYDVNIIYIKKIFIKEKGKQVYNYDKEGILLYKDTSNGKTVFICYDPKISKYKKGDIIENVNENDLKGNEVIGAVPKRTSSFWIVFYPILWTGIALIIIISIYSIFFSHRMAGPVHRIDVSLDRMLSGDYDFQIRVRKKDFFLNVVDKLEKLRQKISDSKKNNFISKKKKKK